MKKIFTFMLVLMAMMLMPSAAAAATYTVAGSAAILNGDASWAEANADNDMTSADGVTYTLTISGISVEAGTYDYKVVTDHSWDECYPEGNANVQLNISETAKYDIVYTFNAESHNLSAEATKVGAFEGSTDKTYTVAGSGAVLGSDWGQTDTSNDMVKGDDGIFRLVKKNVALTAGTTYQFKVVVNHDWGTAYPSSNATFSVSADGNYDVTFTFNEDTKAVAATAEPASAEVTPTTAVFDFTAESLRGYVGTAITDVKGYIYNETYTADGVSLQVTAGSAPSRQYADSKRGTVLVLYKEYATLQFTAPEGKAITKIEFAVGGSGTLAFDASSGTFADGVWEGNATGVRLLNTGTAYLASATLTLTDKTAETATLEGIPYVACENLAAFNALEAGTYVKLTLTDAEVIAFSADGYSTVFLQDATAGVLMQYTSLNEQLKEKTRVSGTVYAVKRVTSGATQLKEALETTQSKLTSADLTDFTVLEGTLAEVNKAENLGRLVKITGASFEATSATAGTLTQGEATISVNNGAATANQQLHKVEFAKGDQLSNVTIVAILTAKSATENQLLPLTMESDASGIATIDAVLTGNRTAYNLQGQRLNSVHKGICIVGGKKLVVK